MKHFVLSLMLMFAVGATAQVDDMYFVPNKSEKKNKSVRNSEKPQMVTTQEYLLGDETWNGIDEDEYNRRGHLTSVTSEDVENEETIYEEVEDTLYLSEETVDEDFSYSSRILRFHSPRVVMLSSPWYWDIVYTSGVDSWLICDDGIYWDVYPAYSYYSSWYYPAWSWNFTFGHWGYYNHFCWDYWHAPVWHGHHHHHYYPHPGGGHHGHFVGGPGLRDNRRPPVIDMRTGKLYASSVRNERPTVRNNNVIHGGNSNVSSENTKGNNTVQNDREKTYVRRGRTGSTTANGIQRAGADDKNKRGTNVRGNSSVNRTNYRGTGKDNTKRERRTTTQNKRERDYNRPSSTRNTSRSTNVERSSSNNRNSSSFSRGGSSRSNSGAGSRGGGSRGGGSRGGRR